MKDPGSPKIHELVHRVALCSQKDVVVNSSTMELRRTGVVWAWARIKSHYGLPMFTGQLGYAIMDPVTKATHAITVRDGLVEFSDTAYVYEEPRKSQPRWYKILGYSEVKGFTVLVARLVEKSDYAIPPQNSLTPQQSPVTL
jgi:hypothetical protein